MADVTTEVKKADGHSTTELRVLISEDKNGMLTVEYESVIKGTGVSIEMRPAHILGQLQGAIGILSDGFYRVVRNEDAAGNSVKVNDRLDKVERQVRESKKRAK